MSHPDLGATTWRTVLLCSLLGFSLRLSADNGNTRFPMITASGTQLQFIFDGRSPNEYVREMGRLRIDNRKVFGISHSSGSGITKLFRRQLIADAPPVFVCQTGICAQPGTASVSAGFCSSCGDLVNNQGSSNNFNQGTEENYVCPLAQVLCHLGYL